MNVTEDGVPIQELIETIKQAIKTANISSIDLDRDLRVGSVQLTLNVVAIHSLGGGLDFRIPFIGMQVKVGSKLTKKDTHRIDISMVPPVCCTTSCRAPRWSAALPGSPRAIRIASHPISR